MKTCKLAVIFFLVVGSMKLFAVVPYQNPGHAATDDQAVLIAEAIVLSITTEVPDYFANILESPGRTIFAKLRVQVRHGGVTPNSDLSVEDPDVFYMAVGESMPSESDDGYGTPRFVNSIGYDLSPGSRVIVFLDPDAGVLNEKARNSDDLLMKNLPLRPRSGFFSIGIIGKEGVLFGMDYMEVCLQRCSSAIEPRGSVSIKMITLDDVLKKCNVEEKKAVLSSDPTEESDP